MKTRLTAFLLALFTLTSVLASCGGNTDTGASDTETTAVTDTETTAAETTRVPLDVPDKDYEGYKFRVLEYTKRSPGDWNQYHSFGWSSDDSGDLINDAVHDRNMIVEEKLNITIEAAYHDDVTAEAKKLILAGSEDYDMYLGFINKAFPLAQEGLLIDLYDVPHINLEAEWWDQPAIRDMSIGNTMYVGVGDATIADEELNYAIFFNKAVAREYNIEDQYQLGRDGVFTVDRMLDAAKNVTHDLNGDGNIDQNDVYGILSSTTVGVVWFVSLGGRMVELNDGKPELVVDSASNVERIERITEIMADKTSFLDASDKSRCPDGWGAFNTMLVEDRALYRVGSVYDIQKYRNMVNDFGILPYPKYNEAQEDYIHLIATQFCPGITVPITSTDLERTGIIIENIAYESKNTVTKAYYDINLYTKVSRDDESGEMFDIIFATKCYDLGKVFNWGTVETLINNAVKGQAFSSLYAAVENTAQTELNKSYEYFNK